jgi:uncharacterized protein (TIGR03437 family)
MLIFNAQAKFTNGIASTSQANGLNSPTGVAVDYNTGEIWLSSENNQAIYRFPAYSNQPTLQPDYSINSPLPLALAVDGNSDLIVAEGINRVSFYFPSIYFKNAASYSAGIGANGQASNSQVAPGMLVNLGRYRKIFNLNATSGFSTLPYPKQLNDIQVLVNGVPAPVYFLLGGGFGWVYMQVPMATPSSGQADFWVEQVSTGQILGASSFTMQAAAPGIFTVNAGGTGQVAANDFDSHSSYLGNNSPSTCTSCNPPTGPLPASSNGYITIYLTGQGYIPNAPQDGAAPNGTFVTPLTPQVYIGGVQATVYGSALSPQYPGLWQISAALPAGTAPNNKLPIYVVMDNYLSTIGGTNSTLLGATAGEPGPDIPLNVPNNNISTMAVK